MVPPVEAALALACLRCCIDADDGGPLTAVLDADIDWTRFVQLTLDHAVTERVFAALSAQQAAVPDIVIAAAEQRLARRRVEAQAATAQLRDVLRALADKEIPVMPFKGPALSELLHGDAAVRTYRDLDFLVPPEHARAALDVLAARGYRRVHALSPAQDAAFIAYAGEDILFPVGQGLPVEPHWAFAPHTLAIDLDYAAIWARSEAQVYCGMPVCALAPEDLLIALCIHGGKEDWLRLQWICDVAALLHRFPPLDGAAVLERATRQGCRRLVLVGLALARDLIGGAPPAPLLAAIEHDPVARRLAARLAELLFTERDVPSIYVVTRLRLAMRERPADKLRYVWRTMTTPRVQHFRAVKLPDRWFAAYRAVKLAHDYLALPAWRLLRPLLRRPPPIGSAIPPDPGRTV